MAPDRHLSPPARTSSSERRPGAGFLAGLAALALMLFLLETDARPYRADTLPQLSRADIERWPHLDARRGTEERVDLLLAEMSIDEKIEQLHGRGQMRTPTNRRLHIPAFQTADGPHGVGEAVWRYLYRDLDRATLFPVSIALGATWSPELARENAAAIAREIRAKGRNWLLAPDINLIRDPRGGRTYESFSEDPVLTAALGTAYVQGAQAEGVLATPKHFAAHHQERFRRTIDVLVDERPLRELYLPAFRAAVTEGGALSVMAASHLVNGAACTENDFLLRKVLKEEWGFAGVVVSDWKCVRSTAPSLRAGLDLEMPKPLYFGPPLRAALDEGAIEEAGIDEAVRRILRVKIEGGIFDGERSIDPHSVHTEEHQELALEIARQSMVLLKNERKLLPLSADLGTVLVAGPNSHPARLGGNGSSEVRPFSTISPLDGIRDLAPPGLEIETEPCCLADGKKRSKQIERIVELARKAGAVVLVLGLDNTIEAEGWDRVGNHLRLPNDQLELLRSVAGVSDSVVVVLNAGGPITMDDWGAQVPAILDVWYAGERGGVAIAEALFGQTNPSGKLPVTFPTDIEQIPSHLGFGHTPVHYDEGIFIGYRYQDQQGTQPLFPFGHGLSYTEFGYSDLELEAQGEGRKIRLQASFQLQNTGAVTGTEIAQLYVADPESSVERPPKELKAFQRVALEPGESRRVVLDLEWRDLAFWHPETEEWTAEPGDFQILVGSSSRDIRLEATFPYEG